MREVIGTSPRNKLTIKKGGGGKKRNRCSSALHLTSSKRNDTNLGFTSLLVLEACLVMPIPLAIAIDKDTVFKCCKGGTISG